MPIFINEDASFTVVSVYYLWRSLDEGHAEPLTDAKNFIVDIGRPKTGDDCDEDRLQDKCCSLEISLSKYEVFCQFVTDCVTWVYTLFFL